MLLVLLTSMLHIEPLEQHSSLEVIEFFAGTGRLCRLAKSMGIPSEAHDLSYDETKKHGKSAMDINDSAGYLFLSLILQHLNKTLVSVIRPSPLITPPSFHFYLPFASLRPEACNLRHCAVEVRRHDLLDGHLLLLMGDDKRWDESSFVVNSHGAGIPSQCSHCKPHGFKVGKHA